MVLYLPLSNKESGNKSATYPSNNPSLANCWINYQQRSSNGNSVKNADDNGKNDPENFLHDLPCNLLTRKLIIKPYRYSDKVLFINLLTQNKNNRIHCKCYEGNNCSYTFQKFSHFVSHDVFLCCVSLSDEMNSIQTRSRCQEEFTTNFQLFYMLVELSTS